VQNFIFCEQTPELVASSERVIEEKKRQNYFAKLPRNVASLVLDDALIEASLEPESVDLLVSNMQHHWVND
jgi:hypothetical protein